MCRMSGAGCVLLYRTIRPSTQRTLLRSQRSSLRSTVMSAGLPLVRNALATAPYWGFGDSDYSGQPLDEIMSKILPQRINETLDLAVQQKAMRAGISFRAAKRSGARKKK